MGIILGSSLAWAKSLYIMLQDTAGNPTGTVASPLYVTTN